MDRRRPRTPTPEEFMRIPTSMALTNFSAPPLPVVRPWSGQERSLALLSSIQPSRVLDGIANISESSKDFLQYDFKKNKFFSKAYETAKENNEVCPVCQMRLFRAVPSDYGGATDEDVNADEKDLLVITECGHVHHKICFYAAQEQAAQCTLCRGEELFLFLISKKYGYYYTDIKQMGSN